MMHSVNQDVSLYMNSNSIMNRYLKFSTQNRTFHKNSVSINAENQLNPLFILQNVISS